MNYIIRKTKYDDMAAVESAHRKSILEVCSKDYTEEQIKRFAAIKYTEDRWNCSLKNDYHIVIEVEGVVEGMCHAKDHGNGIGEIVGLYLAPNVIGKGLGRKVVEMAFDYLLNFNPYKIILTGTKTAKPFYEKMGFVEKAEKVMDIRGADITCFEMVKEIKPS